MASWTIYWGRCKSRLSAISRCCFLSRDRWRKRCRASKALLAEEKVARARCETRLEEAQREIDRLRAELQERELEIERVRLASPTWELPLGEAASGQSYPVGIVTLSVNLARKIGLRPTVSVLKVFFDWLRVPCQVPSYQTIRIWMQRIGLGRMQRAQRVKDGIWLADHSMQIGTEKVLVVLRVRESRLPFFNKNGVFRGSALVFRRKVVGQLRDPISRQLLTDTVQFLRTIENKLRTGQRMPVSTEILESTFASYKQLEQQHAKGGFTSLLPAFGTLLISTTPEEVVQSFACVKVMDVRRWLKTNLPVTLASRRQTAYREALGKKNTKRATQMGAAA